MRSLYFIAASLVAAPAAAEVVAADANGFHVRHQVSVSASSAKAYATLIEPKRWWHPDHNWSGSSDNLYIEPKAGGCFCESLADGGGAVHMQVWQVKPGRELVLAGGLGPLLFAPATGTMHWKIDSNEAGTTITMDYKVFGFPGGDGEAWSKAVDQVLGIQVARLGEAIGK